MIVQKHVTKGLEILVAADPATMSSKAVKARQYGVRIIAEAVFWRLLGLSCEARLQEAGESHAASPQPASSGATDRMAPDGTNLAAAHALRDAGVNMKQPKAHRGGEQLLAGKTIVVTGTLENWGRGEVERLIKQLGGKPVGSVSRKTDFVVVGEDPGSKLAKARELRVKVIDEKEFLRLIGQGGNSQ
jgi:DNA ligase (NAD+)